MAEISLKAEKREITTKGALNDLRKSGYIPGTYYTKESDPISFSVFVNDLNPLVFTSETNMINLEIEDAEPSLCIIKDVQFDPVTDKIIHVDLIGVTLGQVMDFEVPINYTGNAPGIKEGGILQVFLHKMEISCMPRHLPEHLEVPVDALQVGDTIHVRDLSFENVEIRNSEDAAVVSVMAPRAEEEPVVAGEEEEEMVEPEVIGKGKSEEDEETEEN